MKASIKFREEQKPLIRAKIPISILGLPFLSAVSAGNTKELRLDLLTAFESGPSIRASYRPNDPANPFSLSLKTGIGCLGSPAGAPMSMTADFSLSGGAAANPTFTVLFKPRFGDFSLKKSTGSAAAAAATTGVLSKRIAEIDGDESAVWVEKIHAAAGPAGPAAVVGGLLSGVEVSAKSVLPLRGNAAVRFKWGVRVPAELRAALADEGSRTAAAMSVGKMPMLVMSKISIEHVAPKPKAAIKEEEVVGAGADVAESCLLLKRQLDAMKEESGAMRRAVEELKGAVPTPALTARFHQADVSGGVKKEGNGAGRVAAVVPPPLAAAAAAQKKDDVSEELKKALKGATAGGK